MNVILTHRSDRRIAMIWNKIKKVDFLEVEEGVGVGVGAGVGVGKIE